MIIEVAGFGFAVFALYITSMRFREGKLSRQMLVVSTFAWLAVIAFLASPASFEQA